MLEESTQPLDVSFGGLDREAYPVLLPFNTYMQMKESELLEYITKSAGYTVKSQRSTAEHVKSH